MKRTTLLALFATALSAEAYGWKGDGTRAGAGAAKIPCDTAGSAKVQTGIAADIKVEFSNRRNYVNTFKCDLYGEIKATLGSSYAMIRAYVDERLVEPGQGFEQHFIFRDQVLGNGYKLVKDSQRYELACLIVEAGENPAQVPSAHTQCDPEVRDCDFTCKAGQNADQCQDQGQDW